MRPVGCGHIRVSVSADEDQKLRRLYMRISGHRARSSTQLNTFAGALLLGAIIELECALGDQESLLDDLEWPHPGEPS